MKSKSIVYFFAFLLIAAFTACDNEKNDSGSGRFVVKITDEPFPYDLLQEANVTINKIEVRESTEDEGSPFLVLSEEEVTLNLLELTNGITETLVDIEVPAGEYDLVRLYVKDASVLLTDGREFDLTVPSGAQTGIKVFIEPSIVVSGELTSELLLDVDLSSSFVVQGDPGTPAGINGFIFTPVVRATNLSNAGRLSGIVTNAEGVALEGAQISVFVADTLYTTSFTGETGQYGLIGLEPNLYTVSASLRGYVTNQVNEVEIVAGNETTLDFEMQEE
ncbi:MAG: DUF4382 domain-containing protein [Bacteroidota bacterium]